MAKTQKNTSNISGNQNIVIQGCDLNNLNINTLDFAQFESNFRELFDKTVPINIVLLASAPTTILQNIENTGSEVLNSIINTHTPDNKLFCDEQNFLQLLQEYQQKSGYQIKAYIIDGSSGKVGKKILNHLKLWKRNIVFIAEPFALLLENNRTIASIFDDSEIGACLIPSCKCLDDNTKKYINEIIKTVFSTLSDYLSSYSDYLDNRQDEGFLHIDLQMPDKNTFFRLLSSIAAYHLNPKPNRRFRDLDHIEEVPLNPFVKK